MSRTAAVVAGGLAVLASALPHFAAAGGDEPPDSTQPATSLPADTEPADTDGEEPALEGSPAFERRLAEVAFALFLSLDLGVESGTYSCTEPPSLEVGETIVCFTLIGDERVIIAETEVSESSGVFDFVVVSDSTIGPADTPSSSTSTTTTSSPTTSSPTTTALPQPVLITNAPPNPADEALLAYGEQINANAETIADRLISSADGGFITEVNEFSFQPDPATVTLDITLSESWGTGYDVGAWIVVRNLAMEFWNRDSPFRAEGTTIRPSLEIVVNDNRYVSSFDLTVEVADQTIAMTDWVARAGQ